VGVEIVVVLLLTLLNGVFSAAEIAMLSVRKTRLAELVAEGSRGARAVLWLREQPERFLATVQIGITVVSTTAAAFGGDSLADDLAAWMAPRAPWLGGGAHRLALVLVIALLSFLRSCWGSSCPSPSRCATPSASRPLARPDAAGDGLGGAAPRVALHGVVQRAAAALRGPDQLLEARLSRRGASGAGGGGRPHGLHRPGTSEIASRAIDFRELTAFDVMVPREAIVSVSRAADAARLRGVLRGRRFARLPCTRAPPTTSSGTSP
jgi:putative hemolysin